MLCQAVVLLFVLHWTAGSSNVLVDWSTSFILLCHDGCWLCCLHQSLLRLFSCTALIAGLLRLFETLVCPTRARGAEHKGSAAAVLSRQSRSQMTCSTILAESCGRGTTRCCRSSSQLIGQLIWPICLRPICLLCRAVLLYSRASNIAKSCCKAGMVS
jgi:hypothetical protein